MTEHIMQFFAFDHLPPHLKAVSIPFATLAERHWAAQAWAHIVSATAVTISRRGLDSGGIRR